MSNLSYMQKATDRGQLQIHVTTERGFFPIKDASIRLSYTGNPTEIIEELSTDISGQTAAVELPAPPLEYSMGFTEFSLTHIYHSGKCVRLPSHQYFRYLRSAG